MSLDIGGKEVTTCDVKGPAAGRGRADRGGAESSRVELEEVLNHKDASMHSEGDPLCLDRRVRPRVSESFSDGETEATTGSCARIGGRPLCDVLEDIHRRISELEVRLNFVDAGYKRIELADRHAQDHLKVTLAKKADIADVEAELAKKAGSDHIAGEFEDLKMRLSKMVGMEYLRGELEKKANIVDFEVELAKKADRNYVAAELAKKADEGCMRAELATKSDTRYVDAQLAKKASAEYIGVRLANKADEAYTALELAKKVSGDYVNIELAKKADGHYVDVELAKKADAGYTEAGLAKKASRDYVDGELRRRPTSGYLDHELAKKASIEYVDAEFTKAVWEGRDRGGGPAANVPS